MAASLGAVEKTIHSFRALTNPQSITEEFVGLLKSLTNVKIATATLALVQTTAILLAPFSFRWHA
jgi:hypothetical protein